MLLDILALCRQPLSSVISGTPAPSTPSASNTPASTSRAPLSYPNLALAVLDTLLCLLVDAPTAIRVFEQVEGVEAVVKVLKRSETSRDIRYVSSLPSQL